MSLQTVIEKYSAPLTDFSEDKLNLEPFADSLTNIVMSKLPHPTNEPSKVIALNSGWGTGKTSFINMWINKLETNSKLYPNSPKFICLPYNAWENDDSHDALIPILCSFQQLIDSIDSYDKMKILMIWNKIKRLMIWNKIKSLMIWNKIKRLMIQNNKKRLMERLEQLVSTISVSVSAFNFLTVDIVGNIEKSPDTILEKFSARQKHKEELKELIGSIRGECDYLLICIDELDRCRPTFAIETLEVVKHFFNVPNVVFVFSLDMNQLQNSIKTIYGDIDSRGYLQRFFDYIIPLPKQELESFLKDRLEKLNPPRTDYEKEQREHEITWLSWIARQYSISLRSLNNICIMYTKFKEYALSNFDWTKRNWEDTLDYSLSDLEIDIENDKYGQWYYFKTYLTFIVMKYFCPDEYQSFIQNGTNFDDSEDGDLGKNKYKVLWFNIFSKTIIYHLTGSSEEDGKFKNSYTKDIARLTPREILGPHSKTLLSRVCKSQMGFELFQARHRLLVGSEIDMTEYQDLKLPTFIDKIIEESLVKKVNSVKPLQ